MPLPFAAQAHGPRSLGLVAADCQPCILTAPARAPVQQLGPATQRRKRAGDGVRPHRPVRDNGGNVHTGGETAAPSGGVILVHPWQCRALAASSSQATSRSANNHAPCSAMLMPSATTGCASPATLPTGRRPGRAASGCRGRIGPAASHAPQRIASASASRTPRQERWMWRAPRRRPAVRPRGAGSVGNRNARNTISLRARHRCAPCRHNRPERPKAASDLRAARCEENALEPEEVLGARGATPSLRRQVAGCPTNHKRRRRCRPAIRSHCPWRGSAPCSRSRRRCLSAHAQSAVCRISAPACRARSRSSVSSRSRERARPQPATPRGRGNSVVTVASPANKPTWRTGGPACSRNAAPTPR